MILSEDHEPPSGKDNNCVKNYPDTTWQWEVMAQTRILRMCALWPWIHWECVHCDLDLGDMTLGQGHDWVMDNNCVKYDQDQTRVLEIMARRRWTDWQTNQQTGWFLYTPQNFVSGSYNKYFSFFSKFGRRTEQEAERPHILHLSTMCHLYWQVSQGHDPCYTPVFRRDVLWYGDVRPSGSPSARFPHFSHTCFDILSWNFAHDFVLMYYRSSSSVVNFRQFSKELCLFVNLEYR